MAQEFTRGCYGAHFAPGVWTSYGEAWRAPAGRIHWAGAECAPQWNGYMEGAVRSGEAAAAAAAVVAGLLSGSVISAIHPAAAHRGASLL